MSMDAVWKQTKDEMLTAPGGALSSFTEVCGFTVTTKWREDIEAHQTMLEEMTIRSERWRQVAMDPYGTEHSRAKQEQGKTEPHYMHARFREGVRPDSAGQLVEIMVAPASQVQHMQRLYIKDVARFHTSLERMRKVRAGASHS